MSKVTFDASEVRAFAADLRAVPEQLARHTYDVVERGANNIKREIAANFERTKYFKKVAPAVGYDIRTRSFGGDGVIEAEIGPRRGHAGSLAHLAIEGSPSNPEANVPDPQVALDNEAPKFSSALEKLMGELL